MLSRIKIEKRVALANGIKKNQILKRDIRGISEHIFLEL